VSCSRDDPEKEMLTSGKSWHLNIAWYVQKKNPLRGGPIWMVLAVGFTLWVVTLKLRFLHIRCPGPLEETLASREKLADLGFSCPCKVWCCLRSPGVSETLVQFWLTGHRTHGKPRPF